jgi:hypothetical protein
MAKDGVLEAAREAPGVSVRSPVLVIGLGRGGSGKSTLLSEMVWRARSQGREVVVGDFDPRSQTLTDLFPEAVRPEGEALPDVKKAFVGMLNRMNKERRSGVIDFGAGDRFLAEHGRDLRLVEFCKRRGIDLLAMYVLGPDEEDLRHCLSIWEAGYFRPERTVVVMNEGVIRDGDTVLGAFEPTMGDGRFLGMVRESGAKVILVTRLACMKLVRDRGLGFHEAARGGLPDDLAVEEFMVEDWLADLEDKRAREGVAEWLP